MNKKEINKKLLVRSVQNCIDTIHAERAETAISKAYNEKTSIGLFQVQVTVTKDTDAFLEDFEFEVIK